MVKLDVKMTVNKAAMKAIEALRSEISNKDAIIRKFTKVVKELYFCGTRVRSATFRTIDREQFDNAVEAGEKLLIKQKVISARSTLFPKQSRRLKEVQVPKPESLKVCTCFNTEKPYYDSRNTRSYVIIIKGKICCELCQYPLNQVRINYDEYP